MLYVEGTTIKLTRGDTAFLTILIEREGTGQAYELAEEDALVFTVKKNTYEREALIQKKLLGGNLFEFTPEDTAGLDFGLYVYDVQLTTAVGHVFTVVEASDFRILEEVT